MNKLYNDAAVQAIANAIRAKNGSSDTYTIAEMSTALNDLSYYAKPTIENVPLATFEADGLPLNSLKVSVEAKQAGSGTPSPTNVRPISGWDACNVVNMSDATNERYFKGLLDGTYGFEVFDGSNDETINKISGDYNRFTIKISNNSITWTNQYGKSNKLLCNEFNESTNSSTYIGGKGIHFRSSGAHEVVVAFGSEPPSTVEDFRTWLANNNLYLIYELETPTTPTITPSQFKDLLTAFGLDGYYVTITFPSSAGTVYGGTLDVTKGELTVDKAIIDLGDMSWTYQSANTRFVASDIQNTSKYPSSNDTPSNIMCSCYANNSYRDYTDGQIAQSNTGNVFIKDSNYTDAATFTTAVSGQKLVYELAEPIIIPLTPSLIKSLNGTNNLSVDCGDVIELEYFKEV